MKKVFLLGFFTRVLAMPVENGRNAMIVAADDEGQAKAIANAVSPTDILPWNDCQVMELGETNLDGMPPILVGSPLPVKVLGNVALMAAMGVSDEPLPAPEGDPEQV